MLIIFVYFQLVIQDKIQGLGIPRAPKQLAASSSIIQAKSCGFILHAIQQSKSEKLLIICYGQK